MKRILNVHPDDLRDYKFLHRPSEGFVFVVTYGRSGSTVLQNLLNAIPGFCIRGENGNAIYPLCRLIDTLLRDNEIRMRRDQVAGKGIFVRDIGQTFDPWYGAETINLDRFAKGLFDVFCSEILSLPPHIRVGGFKEIRYFHDLSFLHRQLEIIQTYFPCSKIIFLTRDHIQVANSAWWKMSDQPTLQANLLEADRTFKSYASMHADCFVLDYSTYAGGPEGLAPLFEFLQEPIDREVVAKILSNELTHSKPHKNHT